MDSFITLLAQLPYGVDKYETIIAWQLFTEEFKTRLAYSRADFEQSLHCDYPPLYPRRPYIAGHSRIDFCYDRLHGHGIIREARELYHSFPSRFATCETKDQQFDLFAETAKRIEEMHRESRLVIDYFRDCASSHPLKQDSHSIRQVLKECMENRHLFRAFLYVDEFFQLPKCRAWPCGIPSALRESKIVCERLRRQLKETMRDKFRGLAHISPSSDTNKIQQSLRIYQETLVEYWRCYRSLFVQAIGESYSHSNSDENQYSEASM